MKTQQSHIEFFPKENKIKKTYKNNNINKMSSVNNEMKHLKMFSFSKHCPTILDHNSQSYEMQLYDFDLGNTKEINENNIRKLLFYMPIKALFKQLEEIYNDLKQAKIQHRDINPGNLLFCRRDKKIKLIDFYWAITNDRPLTPKGLNSIYGVNDRKALNKIQEEITEVNKKVVKEIEFIKSNIKKNMGKKYYDGSATHKGKTYHKIPIHFFDDMPYHKNITEDFNSVLSNMNKNVKSLTDIGCAGGFYIFNLFKMFDIKSVIGYEADPVMFNIIQSIKNTFRLNEIKFINGLNLDTKLPKSDVTICLNVHMWLVKQFGRSGVDKIMNNLMSNTKEMFFQTTGMDGASMYKVEWLKSKDDIYKYLRKFSGDVCFIKTSKIHDKKYRHMFLLKSKKTNTLSN